MTKVNTIDFRVPEIALQSKDHEEILNVIDHLRSQGISRYISLPQLIVCGDQSSGKSSVLEAVSGLSFPTKDNLCTRFATELILRRGVGAGLSVTIQPDNERSEKEKERLRTFKPPTTALEDFATIVESAEDAMGLEKTSSAFSKDVLRVEVTGPKLPHLTLVDLPGLYHAPDGSQDDEGIAVVESLVLSYMGNERSIMLAVISAKSDLALQKVTAFTRKVDPQGVRTLGIITKPDTLPPGSDMELSFLKLANNERVNFRLGWHVLKNRDFEQRKCSLEERHGFEKEFLSRGVWASLPRRQVGIDALHGRLSVVLKDQILSQLPGLVREAEKGVSDARGGLLRLGESRASLGQQRRYLLHISENFTTLIAGAINGFYFDTFFGDAMSENGYARRLRAVVQNTLLAFTDTIHEQGQQRKIINDADLAPGQKPHKSDQILRSDLVDEVRVRMERSRGRELPGTFNPLIVGDLFYLQSKPWKRHVEECTVQLLEHARQTLSMIVTEVADEKTVEGLLQHILDPTMARIEKSLRMKIAEILRPHQFGHPITYDQAFAQNVQKSRQKHFRQKVVQKLEGFFGHEYLIPDSTDFQQSFKFKMSSLVEALGRQTEADMDRFSCSEAIDCMEAYYKVALRKFIDDFSVLAIEKGLLEQLLGIFSPKVVEALENDTVQRIAAETNESRIERAHLNEKLAGLQDAVQTLRRLDRHKTLIKTPNVDSSLDTNAEDLSQEGEKSLSRNRTLFDREVSVEEVSMVEVSDAEADSAASMIAEVEEIQLEQPELDLFADWNARKRSVKGKLKNFQ